MEDILSTLYYDPKTGYWGVQSLFKLAKLKDKKITMRDVKTWLSKQSVYTMHHPTRKTFKTNRVIVSSIDEQWQADLVDLQSLSKYNDGYRYLLTCIDIFSKYAWAEKLVSKTAENVKEAFKRIFSSGRKPYKLQTDAGTEFINKEVQKFLKSEDVDFFTTYSEKKASVIERFNRTIKERMWKIFSKQNSFRYIDFLPDLMNNYNNTFHRTIKMTPSQVDIYNENVIRDKVFGLDNDKNIKFKFSRGDKVRISKLKRHFEKGFTPNFTEEYFIIDKAIARSPPVYTLKDQQDEQILGIFYEPELQKIENDSETLYVIEKVLRTRKLDGKTDYFVKWRGYSDKFNSWVSDVVKL